MGLPRLRAHSRYSKPAPGGAGDRSPTSTGTLPRGHRRRKTARQPRGGRHHRVRADCTSDLRKCNPRTQGPKRKTSETALRSTLPAHRPSRVSTIEGRPNRATAGTPERNARSERADAHCGPARRRGRRPEALNMPPPSHPEPDARDARTAGATRRSPGSPRRSRRTAHKPSTEAPPTGSSTTNCRSRKPATRH